MTSSAVLFRWKFTGILALLLTAPIGPMRGQEPSTPVFRSTTRLVQLSVVVLDNQNRPVKDLGAQDFQVLDNGVQQKLIHFSRTSESLLATPPPSPLVVTNRPPGQAVTSSTMTVILLDEIIDQNIFAPPALRQLMQSARLEILKFLGTLKPGDQVALYALRPEGVVVVHDFTDDPAVLVEAGKQLGSGLLKGSAMGSATTIGDTGSAQSIRGWLAGSNPRRTGLDQNADFRRYLAGYAFQAIANHLRGIPGRKNVIWISSTFPSMVVGLNPDLMIGERDTILPNLWGPTQPVFANTESYYYQLRDFARSLSNANISVYSIDPQGLMGGVTLTGQGADMKSGLVAPPPVMPSIGPYFIGPWATMDLVASETGGRAFFDKNGLDHMLREVVDETHVAYMLGYYPGDKAWDGKYHKIQVIVKRDGSKALCRKGYFAWDAPLGDPQISLREIAKSPLDGAAIGVTLHVSSNPLEAGPQDIVLNVDAHDIHFNETGGRSRASLDVLYVELGQDGRILGGTVDHQDLALLPESLTDALLHGWLYKKTFAVSPVAEKFRVVVRDLSTGAAGSVSVPVRQYGHK